MPGGFLPEWLHVEFHWNRHLLEPSDEMVCRILDGGETVAAKVGGIWLQFVQEWVDDAVEATETDVVYVRKRSLTIKVTNTNSPGMTVLGHPRRVDNPCLAS